MLLILLKSIGAIYLVGAIVAVVIMVIRDQTILANDPKEDRYRPGEYVLGFFTSWVAVAVISGWHEEKK